MKKAFLSILFALAACLALLSTAALAAEPGSDPSNIVSVTVDGQTTSYADLNDIGKQIDKKTATINLLSNAGGSITVENALTELTLNLNGHTLTGGLTVTGGNVTVNANGGKITGAVSLTNGYLTLNGGTYNSNVTASSSTLNITSGTFNGTVNLGNGRARLSGGTFATLKAGNDLKTYLAEDRAFADKNDTTKGVPEPQGEVSNVTVIEHYSDSHIDEDKSVGSCDFCGKALEASVTAADDSKQYFETIAGALENVPNGKTVTLLRQASLTSNTTISGKSFTLDLGEKGISVSNEFPNVTLTIASGASLTLTGTTNGELSVPVAVNGTLTVDSAVTLGEVSVNSGNVVVNADAKFTLLSITSGTATLNSGTFAALSVGTGETIKGKNFLGTGCAYYTTKWLTAADLDLPSLSNVSVKTIPIKSVSVSTEGNKTNFAYGENVVLTATASLADSVTATPTYKWVNAGNATDLSQTGASITLNDLAPNADGNKYNIMCIVTVDGYSLSENIEFTVSKAPLTEGTHYTAPTAKTGLTYENSDQELVNAGSFMSNVTTTGSNAPKFLYGMKRNGVMEWGDTVKDGRNAGTYTVYWYIKGGTNYESVGSDTQPAGTLTVAIGKATPTAADFTADNLTVTYDGSAKSAKVTGNKNGMGAVTVKYFKGDSAITPTNAGAYTVKISVAEGDNYTAATDLTAEGWTFTINKASFSGGSFNYGVNVQKGKAHSYTYDLGTFLPGLPENCSYGQISYAIESSTLLSDFYDSGSATINGSTLTLPIKSTAQVIGNTGKLTITVTSDNYEPIDLQISPNFIEGTPLNGVPTLSRTSLTYGEKLSAITLSGTMTDALTGASVSGTFSWNNSEFKATSVGLMVASWDFRITGNNSDSPDASGVVHLTVLKATPTGAPTYTAITTAGKKLADAALAVGSITPAGTIAWELGDDTEVAANTAYKWIFTPTDSTKYNTLSGSITLYRVSAPSGGGSSSGSTSSSTTVTVPVTSESSSVSVKAEVTQTGTATVEISDKQIEEVAQHGSGTVTVDVSGLKNVESVQVPAHVVETTNKAEGTGLTVALPAGSVTLDETALESVSGSADVTVAVQNVPAAQLTAEQKTAIGAQTAVAVVVDVDLFVGAEKQSTFNGGTLTISVPYTPKTGEDTSKLTVWFIRDDGTIENKGGYYDAEKKCFVFETEHLSRYVLVYNDQAPSFTDVAPDAYYAAAVNWAVAQNITDGIGGGKFGPDLGCTRAQIVTFLYRCAVANGVDVSIGADTNILSYSDALDIPEYAVPAFQWAVGAGIIQGADGKLMPNDDCTRAQIVTMLYRYEAANGMDFVTLQELVGGFADASEVPGYALSAFNWALGANIIQGADDKLMPSDTCTRGQIVTMLYRLLGE